MQETSLPDSSLDKEKHIQESSWHEMVGGKLIFSYSLIPNDSI